MNEHQLSALLIPCDGHVIAASQTPRFVSKPMVETIAASSVTKSRGSSRLCDGVQPDRRRVGIWSAATELGRLCLA